MASIDAEQVHRQIAERIRDPAVNLTIGQLGIIRDVALTGDRLTVRLRPCTPDCWPLAMAGIARSIRRYAADHGLTAEIEVEPVMLLPEAELQGMVHDLERNPTHLRELWTRSYTVSLLTILTQLQVRGMSDDAVASLEMADLPARVGSGALSARMLDALRHWRRELGLPNTGPLLIDADGEPIADLPRWRRTARLALISQQTYGAICRDTRDAYHAQPLAPSDSSAASDGR
ncbi:MAG: hypothetical protein QJR03_10140 [Sphaerobacter sp.]|nr:hypothetical protein [Sphaerobacter sp.]